MWGLYFIIESLPVHVNICGQLICMCLQGRPSKIPPLSQPWQKYFSKRNMGVEDHKKYLFAFVPARFWHSRRYLKLNKKITKKLHCFFNKALDFHYQVWPIFLSDHCDCFLQHNTDTGGADHSCSICGKSLSSASSLDRHMLVHSGERPYKCTVCGQSFTTNGNMHRWVRVALAWWLASGSW